MPSAQSSAIEMRGPHLPSAPSSCGGMPWFHERFHLSLKYMSSPELIHGFEHEPPHSAQHFLRYESLSVSAWIMIRRDEPSEKHAVATFSLNEHVQSRPARSRWSRP